jgi:hypothetical protein
MSHDDIEVVQHLLDLWDDMDIDAGSFFEAFGDGVSSVRAVLERARSTLCR